ncbi:helix-turn-helix transcriptional regulator, XRE family [Geotalea daltonii FRC-32]|uniref:Helix-turn-helix transcriptional regulator, XRE family n=1 Tax=Geotalea daltonii (strain DSM 22248 / JCM 15807 / FRC-32) TaxID=316067 RepID=B9M0B4_GEODF|nr:helix-turn-helix transcriptional regulator [Geotalea daltonii]ACM18951.1 helix-turn-helix transcriptional regulator, XRE family [Geotalea daltonii FRC-32]
MQSKNVSFGTYIAEVRKAKTMSQKEVAAKLDISPQYLNDIEHDKRSPSSPQLIDLLATTLEISADYLSYLAGRIPEEVKERKLDPVTFEKAMVAFRKATEKK